MDFGFFKFFRDLGRAMASIETTLERLLNFVLTERAELLGENASLKEQLAAEELDDLTLQEEAEAAREVAIAAQAKADELQALADADLEQDARLAALIDAATEAVGLVEPAEEPAAE